MTFYKKWSANHHCTNLRRTPPIKVQVKTIRSKFNFYSPWQTWFSPNYEASLQFGEAPLGSSLPGVPRQVREGPTTPILLPQSSALFRIGQIVRTDSSGAKFCNKIRGCIYLWNRLESSNCVVQTV